MEKKSIGSFLAALRKANGLTQKQLAEKLNVSDKAVSRWERDECAPDLSLIPVLAEIYGVTSDEILRGQRRDPEMSEREPDTSRSEKQLRRLLERTQTKFRIRSIIAAAIAIVGIIAAAICNHGLNQAAIGFMVGSIFFVAAVVCQIIFLILGFSAVNAEELDSDTVRAGKRSMVHITELIVGTVAVLAIGASPLITITDGAPYFGLDAGYVFEEGLSNALLTAVICLIAVYIINCKTGYAQTPNLSKPVRRLLLRCGGMLLLVLILIFVVQLCLNILLLDRYYIYVTCQRFDSLEEFKEYIETPTAPDGSSLTLIDTDQETESLIFYTYTDKYGNIYQLSNQDKFYLLQTYWNEDNNVSNQLAFEDEPFTEEYNYPYLRFNLSIAHIEISNETKIVPIYTFTDEQFALASDLTLLVNLAFYGLDLAAITITIIIFIKKRKNL